MNKTDNILGKYGFTDPNEIVGMKTFNSESEDITERYMSYLQIGGHADFETWAEGELSRDADRDLENLDQLLQKRRERVLLDSKINDIESGEVTYKIYILRAEIISIFILIFLFMNVGLMGSISFAWYYDLLVAASIVSTTLVSKKIILVHWSLYSVVWAGVFYSLASWFLDVENSTNSFIIITTSSLFCIFMFYKRFRFWKLLNQSLVSAFDFYFPNF